MATPRSSRPTSTTPTTSARTPFPLTRLGRFELRRFRGVMPKIALIFVMCVPLLYAAIYLTANWDPYGKLDRLPVAVVNTDTGAKVDGKIMTAGDDFVTQLVDGHTFDFREVTQAEADRGLREGDYFLTISVPSDFSANLVSGMGDDPQRAGIALRRNDANGFVIGTITSKAQSAVTEAVNASAEEAYFKAVFANLSTIRTGLVDARDGAGRLATGLDDASTGAEDLATGATSAKSGATTIATGAGTLATGLQTATTGASSLSTGLGTLDTSSGRLATGARQVADGTQELEDKVVPPIDRAQKVLPQIEKAAGSVSGSLDDIADAATGTTGSVAGDLAQTSAQLDALEKAHPELADDPSWVTARQRVTSAATRAQTIADTVDTATKQATSIKNKINADGGVSAELATAKKNVTTLNDGAQQVATGATQLHTGIRTAATGARTLSSGISDAATGATELSTGATTLSTGLGTLATGATRLSSGLTTLDQGAHTLHDGLRTGAARIPVLSGDQTADAVQVLSAPADVSMTVDNPATYYGRGLAPMFFGIALWVFGISVFLVVRPISGRALAGRASALRLAITGWLPIGAIAMVGSMLMLATVWLGLGLDPVHPGLIIAVTALAAACYSAIAHLLRTALGTTGSSLLLVLLILQLTAGGGTYPAALLPGFFQAISPYLPMTYLIDAFRILISGGLSGHLLRDVVVLLASLVLALTATVLVVSRRKQLSMKDLHPPLISP